MTDAKDLREVGEFVDLSISKIKKNFSDKMLKGIYATIMDFGIFDNNEKADRIIKYLESYDFIAIGTGTNRTAFRKDGYVFKIALDRRGIVDNYTEFKRSQEVPQYLAKTYETNGLIAVAEYLTLLSKEDFIAARSGIKQIIDNLSKYYLIGDLGLTEKNYCNWGLRESLTDNNRSIVALDYAYMHHTEGYEEAMICNICGSQIEPNQNYTGYKCIKCGHVYDYVDMYQKIRRLKSDLDLNDSKNLESTGFIDFYGLEK